MPKPGSTEDTFHTEVGLGKILDYFDYKVIMATRHFLGEFEQMMLLTVLRLDERAYATPIREELAMCTGREFARGAIWRPSGEKCGLARISHQLRMRAVFG